MGNYISNSLTNLLELFTSHSHKPSVIKSSADITQMVEHVVDVVDPKIRVIGRYAQKLSQPLSHTWDYLNDIANLIPGDVSLSKATFANDPRMKLIFDSQGVIKTLLDTVSSLIQHPVNDNNKSSTVVYMLLCMEKTERNFLGSELAGNIIKRDVLQTKVTFTNRKFLSAGYAEDDAKLGFMKCALEGLLHKAHSLVIESRNEQKQLIERKRQIRQQLNTSHAHVPKEHSNIFTRNDYLLDAPPELQDIERQLAELRIKSESPDHHLGQIIEVLNRPEQYIKMEKQTLLLNKNQG